MEFRRSKIFIGTSHRESIPSSVRSYLYNSWGFNKPLIKFHTHPDPSTFSIDDIVLFIGWQRTSYISIVGHEKGVAALFQTAESPTQKILMSRLFSAKYRDLESQLNKNGYKPGFRRALYTSDHGKAAQAVEEEGVAYYHWNAEGKVKRGDLSQGVVLKRPLAA